MRIMDDMEEEMSAIEVKKVKKSRNGFITIDYKKDGQDLTLIISAEGILEAYYGHAGNALHAAATALERVKPQAKGILVIQDIENALSAITKALNP